MSANEKITMRQLQILIFLGAMGTGVIVLPRRAADLLPDTSQDGWIVALGITVVAMLIGALISCAVTSVARATKSKSLSFIESTGTLLSKPIAYIIGAALWAKLVFAAGLEMRVFMEITGEVLLPLTPAPVIGAVMLATCAYAAAMGIETRARVGEVLLAIMVLPFIFLFVFAVIDADFSNIQPVLATEPQRLGISVLRMGFIFTGMETLLLISPFVPKDKPLVRPVVGAIALSGIVITAITAVTIAAFGQGVASEAWPVLRMMDMINLPGSFIERQEALMFSFWLITAFALGNAMLFFGGLLVKDIFSKSLRKKALPKGVLITAIAVFAVSCIPLTREEIYYYLDAMYMTSGLFFLIILPVLLIFASKICTWGQKRIQRVSKSAALFLVLAGATFLLTSCWDRVEIENRAFVVAIGIDKAENNDDDESENRYTITLSVPILGEDNEANSSQNNSENDGENETPPSHIRQASGQTITEALKELDAKTDKQLYYGQAKLLVLGTGLLEDSGLVDGVINIFNNMLEIDSRMHVLAAENAAEVLYVKPPGETMPGLYVSEIYRHKHKLGGTAFALDFERLSTTLTCEEASGAIVPKIAEKNEELQLSGAIALKDRKLKGYLSPEEFRGFLWCFPKGGQGAIITAPASVVPKKTKPQNIPMKVESHKVKTHFEPIPATAISPASLRVIIDVTATGQVDEYHEVSEAEQQVIQTALAQEIIREITQTAAKLQHEHGIDGFGWLEQLRKKDYPLYKLHAENWNETFPAIEVIPRVKVLVKNI